MVAMVKCIPCQMDDHDHCRVGQTRPGVLGGWMCNCKHIKKDNPVARGFCPMCHCEIDGPPGMGCLMPHGLT